MRYRNVYFNQYTKCREECNTSYQYMLYLTNLSFSWLKSEFKYHMGFRKDHENRFLTIPDSYLHEYGQWCRFWNKPHNVPSFLMVKTHTKYDIAR